nr:2706_t:CDS:2 [Entrophospora candida]
MDFTVNKEYKCFPTLRFLNIEVALLNKHIECTIGDESNKLRCLQLLNQHDEDEIMNIPTDDAILEAAKERIIVKYQEYVLKEEIN